MSQFKVFVDWDWTLFDTTAFIEDLWKDISRQSGVPVQQVAADGEVFHINPRLGGYDFEKHIKSYGLEVDAAWHSLNDLLTAKDYLYPDSEQFMNELLGRPYSTSILSFGEDTYQRAKIAPYLKRFSKEVSVDTVFEKKAQFIARHYMGKRGALVDDVPEQNLPKGFAEIHLDRSTKLKSPKSVGSLSEVLKAIDGIVGL